MGFFKDIWDGIKSVGKWIGGVFYDFGKGLWSLLTGVLGPLVGLLVIAAYFAWLWVRNIGKTRAKLSPCLIGVIDHLFHGAVELSNVEIVVNASGVVNAKAVTKGHTIYWEGDFDEYKQMGLLLHELFHTQQYSDWGYVPFATLYSQQAAFHLSHDEMPIEKDAAAFSKANLADSRKEYRYDCLGLPRPGDVILEEEAARPDDWTMLLGLT